MASPYCEEPRVSARRDEALIALVLPVNVEKCDHLFSQILLVFHLISTFLFASIIMQYNHSCVSGDGSGRDIWTIDDTCVASILSDCDITVTGQWPYYTSY